MGCLCLFSSPSTLHVRVVAMMEFGFILCRTSSNADKIFDAQLRTSSTGDLLGNGKHIPHRAEVPLSVAINVIESRRCKKRGMLSRCSCTHNLQRMALGCLLRRCVDENSPYSLGVRHALHGSCHCVQQLRSPTLVSSQDSH